MDWKHRDLVPNSKHSKMQRGAAEMDVVEWHLVFGDGRRPSYDGRKLEERVEKVIMAVTEILQHFIKVQKWFLQGNGPLIYRRRGALNLTQFPFKSKCNSNQKASWQVHVCLASKHISKDSWEACFFRVAGREKGSNVHPIPIPKSTIRKSTILLLLSLIQGVFGWELPLTLHEITNLRRLELKGTTLTKAPLRLGKLKNLHVWLDKFEVGKSNEFSIQQLLELNLHEELSIKNLENIINSYEANLKNKTHIVSLRLEWNLVRDNEDSVKEREVLENLQPSRHLKHLSIEGYGGTQFPHWLSNNSLSNVVSLTLSSCKHCVRLPSLALLTFLEELTIDGLDGIGRIDADFYRNSSCAFASLKTLSFNDMKEWEEWQCMTLATLP
ncbi:hypothetical protein V8G54_009257 [Vigna mungo]|uniref:R13L1/DRL21-like LRR repeat region domain-containing protein n=1 Tax=Vigna mungo TaxID=3915 RepID=A0AAQ3NU47_VIGMU